MLPRILKGGNGLVHSGLPCANAEAASAVNTMNRLSIEATSSSLRRKRSQVGRNRDDVVLGKVRHCFLHECRVGAGARSILQTNELPGDIYRLQSGYSGHFPEALQLVPVTGRALNGFALAAGLDQILTLGDTPRWNIS